MRASTNEILARKTTVDIEDSERIFETLRKPLEAQIQIFKNNGRKEFKFSTGI